MDIRTIRHGDYTAMISVERGANPVALRHEGYGARLLREPLILGEPDHPFLYGAPILFPVNRISGGRFEFEGREYVFPLNEPETGCHLHGVLHEMPFEVLEEEPHRILCGCRVPADSIYPAFPHDFELRLEYRLDEDGFHQRAQVINHSDTNMPCLIGFHTTFNVCMTHESRPEDVRVLVELGEEYERNRKTYLPTGVKPKPDEVTRQLASGEFCPVGTPISRHYRASGEGRMELYDRGTGLRMIYRNDSTLGFRLIYNGDANEYICLEPQTSLANSSNAPIDRQEAGFGWIPPHRKQIYHSMITLIKEK